MGMIARQFNRSTGYGTFGTRQLTAFSAPSIRWRMALSIRPTTARLLERLRGRDFTSVAFETEEWAPAIRRHSRPAPCLPDDPGRILAYQEETSPELDRQRAEGRSVDHQATILRRYRDVTIVDGIVYAGQSRLVVAKSDRRRPFVLSRPIEIERALLCTNPVIDRYFGHWLLDGMLLERLAVETGSTPLTVSQRRWLHEPGYRALLAMNDVRHHHVRIAELTVADDRGLNDSWRDRGLKLRETLGGAIGLNAGAVRVPVFVRRGTTGAQRTMVNEDDLADALAARGYTILSPEKEDAGTIAATLARASVIVLVEGSSQLHAMVAAQPGTSIIAIMPPRRVNSFLKPVADALDLNWAYTVADDRPEGEFFQPLDRLLRVIDLAIAAP